MMKTTPKNPIELIDQEKESANLPNMEVYKEQIAENLEEHKRLAEERRKAKEEQAELAKTAIEKSLNKKERIPFGEMQNVEYQGLDTENFHYHAFNADEKRIREALQAGYVPADEDFIDPLTDFRLQTPAFKGGDKSFKSAGGGDYIVMMKIPKEIWEEDERKRNRKELIEEQERKKAAIARSLENSVHGSFLGNAIGDYAIQQAVLRIAGNVQENMA